MKKKIKYNLLKALVPLLSLLLRMLSRTIRWEKRPDYELYKGKVIALLHGNALCVALAGIDRDIYTLVSRFRDGDLADALLRRLGYRTVRGSTEEGRAEKGGRTALLRLVQVLKEGQTVAITVDGPKGPAGKVKEGVLFLAQKTGKPIAPVYVKVEKAIRLNSWDKFTIPLPFTKAYWLAGKDIYVKEGEDIEEKRRLLEEVLAKLSES